MAQPHWGTAEGGRTWNQLWLGGKPIPGIATVTGLRVAQDVDTKKAKGSDGATSTDNGVEPSTWTIEIQICSRQQYEAWQAVLPSINPRRPGGQRFPLEIRHPDVNEFGITQCRTIAIEPTAPTGRSGRKYAISCAEWFPAPKKTKPPVVLKNNPNTKYTEDPNTLARDMQRNLSGIIEPSENALLNL